MARRLSTRRQLLQGGTQNQCPAVSCPCSGSGSLPVGPGSNGGRNTRAEHPPGRPPPLTADDVGVRGLGGYHRSSPCDGDHSRGNRSAGLTHGNGTVASNYAIDGPECGLEFFCSTQKPWRMVGAFGRSQLLPADGGYSTATGFLVGPRHVATASHVIPWLWKPNDYDNPPFGELPAIGPFDSSFVPGTCLDFRTTAVDVAYSPAIGPIHKPGVYLPVPPVPVTFPIQSSPFGSAKPVGVWALRAIRGSQSSFAERAFDFAIVELDTPLGDDAGVLRFRSFNDVCLGSRSIVCQLEAAAYSSDVAAQSGFWTPVRRSGNIQSYESGGIEAVVLSDGSLIGYAAAHILVSHDFGLADGMSGGPLIRRFPDGASWTHNAYEVNGIVVARRKELVGYYYNPQERRNVPIREPLDCTSYFVTGPGVELLMDLALAGVKDPAICRPWPK